MIEFQTTEKQTNPWRISAKVNQGNLYHSRIAYSFLSAMGTVNNQHQQ
jgi:hypothetical protein